jgi:O-antigen/teichoic acid export membrane protein
MIVNAKFGVTSSSYMIAITSLTSVSVSLISFFVVCRASRLHFSIKIARKTIRLYAAKYIDFVRFSTAAEVFSTASLRLPIFLASEFFDKSIAATYGVVVRLAISPVIIVLGYFSQRFLSDISYKARNNRNPKAIFVMYTKILFFYASVQALAVLFLIDYVFSLAFGDSFKNGPEMMIIMLPWLTGMCIVEPMGNIFLVYGRQDIIFKNKFISFVISGFSFYVGWLFSDFMLGLKIFSWTRALFYMFVWLRASHIINSLRLDKG